MLFNPVKVFIMNANDLRKNFEAFYDLFAENTRGHVIDQKIDEDYIRRKANEIYDYLESGKAILIGAFENDKLIGFLWAYQRIFLEECRIYINSLIISDTYRGKGIGKLLVNELEKKARALKIPAIDVSTATFKKNTIKFYTDIGFEPERIQLRKPLK
jgi:ribosomal protein S18 acetylase RimI-like enzyme